MKPLDSEKNLTFMNHPERVAAQKELDEAVLRISTDIKVGGSAMYYLTILPPVSYTHLDVYKRQPQRRTSPGPGPTDVCPVSGPHSASGYLNHPNGQSRGCQKCQDSGRL